MLVDLRLVLVVDEIVVVVNAGVVDCVDKVISVPVALVGEVVDSSVADEALEVLEVSPAADVVGVVNTLVLVVEG